MTGMHRIDRIEIIKKYPVHPVNPCKKQEVLNHARKVSYKV